MSHLINMLKRYPALNVCENDIQKTYELIKESYQNGGKLLVCGNGGSAADSGHIVGELMKGFMLRRNLPSNIQQKIKESAPNGDYISQNLQGALPAISLMAESPLISAFANDVAADMVFAQQVYGHARVGDCLICISTSGNAKNVLYAAETAKAMDMKTIALTGELGGALKKICDVSICAPSSVTPEIQEYHLPVYHTLCMMLEEKFFG